VVKLLGNLIPTPDVVLHERYLGDGPDGPQWAAPVSRACRIQRGQKRLQLADSRVVVLTATVFLLGHDDVSTQDRLTWDGAAHTVEQLDTVTWLSGQPMHHEAGVV
jgi:hypothetical protein